MFREYFLQGTRARRAGAWGGLGVFLGHQLFKAYLKWALNEWYESFYDVLQSSASPGSGEEAELQGLRAQVAQQLWDFAAIVAPAVVVHPLAGLARNWWVFVWRRALVKTYLGKWDPLLPPVEGASQRVHEDTQRFASGIQTCVAVVLESVFTLAVFCPVLWGLDPMLMWTALGFALGGLGVSFLVGHRLVGLEVNNQRAEAALRRDLVLLEAEPASLQSRFGALVHDLTRNYAALYLNFAGLATWLAAFDQSAVILPYALVAARLFASGGGRITLGQLMKITNSFDRVFSSLNVVSDNWLQINEWRSCRRRLAEFERALYGTQLVPPQTELSDAEPAAPAPPPASTEDPPAEPGLTAARAPSARACM
mgnify:CR=1 FL=1